MLPLALAASMGKLENPLPWSQVIMQYEMERGGSETLWAKEGLKCYLFHLAKCCSLRSVTTVTTPGCIWTESLSHGAAQHHRPLWAAKDNLIKLFKSSLQVLRVTRSTTRGNISDTLFSWLFLLAAFHSPPSQLAEVSAGFGCLTLHSVDNPVPNTH